MITAKITKKGQITIPAKFRKKLRTNIVKINMIDDKVIIKPARNLGGILQQYAIKDKTIEEIMKSEEEAFADAMEEKHSSNRR